MPKLTEVTKAPATLSPRGGKLRICKALLLLAMALLALTVGEPPAHAATGRPARVFAERWVPRGIQRLYLRDYPGAGPPFILMHGFPDNSHLYDRLVGHLAGRRVITFDFLGWGRSSKPRRHRYTFQGQEADLDAVIRALGLRRVVLVAHDAAGPAAVNWALDHPSGVAGLALMNSFYAPTPSARPPALISLLAFGHIPTTLPTGALPPGITSNLFEIAQAVAARPTLFRALFDWQERRFFARARDARHFIPLFARPFLAPGGMHPLLSLTADLLPAVIADGARIPQLAALTAPIRLIWGGRDPDLNVQSARYLNTQVPRAKLYVLPHANHNLQIDEPSAVARLLLPLAPIPIRVRPTASSTQRSPARCHDTSTPPPTTAWTAASSPTGRGRSEASSAFAVA
jgi:pimeloyl-ACP methyl ester carboxylesterase